VYSITIIWGHAIQPICEISRGLFVNIRRHVFFLTHSKARHQSFTLLSLPFGNKSHILLDFYWRGNPWPDVLRRVHWHSFFWQRPLRNTPARHLINRIHLFTGAYILCCAGRSGHFITVCKISIAEWSWEERGWNICTMPRWFEKLITPTN